MDARLDARIDQGTVAHTKLAAAWPLFALRVRTERLELWLPTDDDLLDLVDLARSGIHPPGEMPFGVPWSTLESPGFERGFLASTGAIERRGHPGRGSWVWPPP